MCRGLLVWRPGSQAGQRLADQPEALSVAEQALDRYRALPQHRPEVESRLLERLGAIRAGRGDLAAARAYIDRGLQLDSENAFCLRLADRINTF